MQRLRQEKRLGSQQAKEYLPGGGGGGLMRRRVCMEEVPRRV